MIKRVPGTGAQITQIFGPELIKARRNEMLRPTGRRAQSRSAIRALIKTQLSLPPSDTVYVCRRAGEQEASGSAAPK